MQPFLPKVCCKAFVFKETTLRPSFSTPGIEIAENDQRYTTREVTKQKKFPTPPTTVSSSTTAPTTVMVVVINDSTNHIAQPQLTIKDPSVTQVNDLPLPGLSRPTSGVSSSHLPHAFTEFSSNAPGLPQQSSETSSHVSNQSQDVSSLSSTSTKDKFAPGLIESNRPVLPGDLTGPSQLWPSRCGSLIQELRIYGGSRTMLSAYPWMTVISYTSESGH